MASCLICRELFEKVVPTDDILVSQQELATDDSFSSSVCTTRCGHMFHTTCVKKCLNPTERISTCPICKKRISKNELIAIYQDWHVPTLDSNESLEANSVNQDLKHRAKIQQLESELLIASELWQFREKQVADLQLAKKKLIKSYESVEIKHKKLMDESNISLTNQKEQSDCINALNKEIKELKDINKNSKISFDQFKSLNEEDTFKLYQNSFEGIVKKERSDKRDFSGTSTDTSQTNSSNSILNNSSKINEDKEDNFDLSETTTLK